MIRIKESQISNTEFVCENERPHLEVSQLGIKHYEQVWELQKDLVKKRQLGLIPDSLIMK